MPLVIIVRAEPLRIAWVIVAMTGIGLWSDIGNNGFHSDYPPQMLPGCAAALMLASSLSRPFRRFTAAGIYSSGAAIVVALGITSLAAYQGIIHDHGMGPGFNFLVLILLAAIFYSQAASFDLVALCACTFALNFLIDSAVVSAMLGNTLENILSAVFIIGVIACSLCGMSIAVILAIMRRQTSTGGSNE